MTTTEQKSALKAFFKEQGARLTKIGQYLGILAVLFGAVRSGVQWIGVNVVKPQVEMIANAVVDSTVPNLVAKVGDARYVQLPVWEKQVLDHQTWAAEQTSVRDKQVVALTEKVEKLHDKVDLVLFKLGGINSRMSSSFTPPSTQQQYGPYTFTDTALSALQKRDTSPPKKSPQQ